MVCIVTEDVHNVLICIPEGLGHKIIHLDKSQISLVQLIIMISKKELYIYSIVRGYICSWKQTFYFLVMLKTIVYMSISSEHCF